MSQPLQGRGAPSRRTDARSYSRYRSRGHSQPRGAHRDWTLILMAEPSTLSNPQSAAQLIGPKQSLIQSQRNAPYVNGLEVIVSAETAPAVIAGAQILGPERVSFA